MTAPDLVLVRSPLVGPSFWEPVAHVLAGQAWRCSVPSVGSADEIMAWRDWPRAACAELQVADGAILVGHSAAGFLLPALARRVNAAGLVFVDAPIPPDLAGAVPPASPEFLRFVASLPSEDGLLPRWSRWWGDGAIERLIADPNAFERFEADLPRLPRAWFDDEVELPPWQHLPAGYLQTSARFEATARTALDRGWPVRALSGTHLHPLLAPEQTASALLEIVGALAPRPS